MRKKREERRRKKRKRGSLIKGDHVKNREKREKK